MRDFEERIVSELDELDERMSALSAFMYGDVYSTLPDLDQYMLTVQFQAMSVYAAVLADRIKRFKG